MSTSPTITLPASADFHVHLRDGAMMEVVTPTIRNGGVDTVYVMPNLVPPVTTVQAALDYKSRLQAISPDVAFLMTLYLHESVTPDTIREAAKAGISGVKAYPKGLTTNSELGVSDYKAFYPVFEALQEAGMVLNLHGEAPSSDSTDTTVLSAEEKFLPTLHEIHDAFPKLKIVLEHCTTAAAVEAVKKCGPTVAGTITAHHLYLTIDSVVASPMNYCKPVAKLPSDRAALIEAAFSGSSKFFLGSDSAPHPLPAKIGGKTAAGIFTQPYVSQLVLEAWRKHNGSWPANSETILSGFLSSFGRDFYGLEQTKETVTYTLGAEDVQDAIRGSGIEVVPFMSGYKLASCTWNKK